MSEAGGKHRLKQGGRIDRSRPIKFRFEGRELSGFEGDTLASALLANGERIVGRSFKYHRPRGVIADGVEESNAIVQLGTGALSEPNLKATLVPLREGLEARAVNAWPNVRFDVRAAIDLFHALLPAGFYYKTFMWPRWNLFSGAIRNVAGLGRAPKLADPSAYETRFAHCDVLVVGGGPAGIAAALTAGRSGARVMLVDDKGELGGSLLAAPEEIDGKPGLHWVSESATALGAMADVTVLSHTTAFGYYDHNLIALREMRPVTARQRLWKVRARQVVIATGAFERPLVFPNNDRPGVMLASAARAYVNRFAVKPGDVAVIATNNDSAYAAALDLAAAGVTVAAILDSRAEPKGARAAVAQVKGLRVLTGCVPVNVRGRGRVSALVYGKIDARGTVTTGGEIACDLVGMSGGWNPGVHLFSQSGGRLKFDAQLSAFVPDQWVQGGAAAGAALGVLSLGGAIESGARAGAEAARKTGFTPEQPAPVNVPEIKEDAVQEMWRVPVEGRAWVDFLNDVTVGDIQLAARENYVSIEHLKRYTTTGMGVDQGKTSNVNAIGVLSEAIKMPIPEIGTTKFRPPFDPVTMGAIAGRRLGAFFHAVRKLPAHAAHEELGARIEDYGGWARPAFYPEVGENEESAVRREVAAVRNNVGVFDASPLGKIRVRGAGASEFLNRIYLNTITSIKTGNGRYVFMLREDGVVLDDGILLRLGQNDWLVGTTSGKANAVSLWLEEWSQCEWPDLPVAIENVTSAWATITLTGPKAREVLQALSPSMDLSDAAFPHLAFRDGTIAGVPTRIARVSFTGERSYEVNVPSDYGESLWRACLSSGEAHGIVPFGVEALMRLRLEKGYLHLGADTDVTTYPQDIGYGAIAAKKTGDFVGRRSTTRSDAARTDRRQFVGLEPLDPAQVIHPGGHVIGESDRVSQGWVTSAGYSPTLKRHVALAMIAGGTARIGETVTIFDHGKTFKARIAEPCALDKEGARLNA